MKKILSIGSILLTTALFLVGGFFVVAPLAHATTITVCASGCGYTTIQAAITAATSGDIINVAAGTYNEQIIVNKKLTINGSNVGISAGVNAGTRVTESTVNGGFIISIAPQYYGTPVDGTVVDGFTVLGGEGFSGHNNGFSVESSGNLGITIQNNIIQNVTSPDQSEGIETVAGTNNLTIKNNNISHNWRGIYLTPASGIKIMGNIIDSNNGVGVGIGSSGQSNLTISGNIISNHTVEGWGIDTVGANVVANNNSFTGNTAGVDWYSGSTINATCNWWGASNGPGPVGPGSGDKVSINVDFTPWLTTSSLTGACNGGVVSPITTPVITTPANNSTVTTSAFVKIDWTDVTDGTSPYLYQYQAFSDAAYTGLIYDSGMALSASEIPTLGTSPGDYYVRVMAQDSLLATSAWSNGSGTPYKITVIADPVTPPTVPTDMNQCKNGGWLSFTHIFKNQGQCVSYVQANEHAGKK